MRVTIIDHARDRMRERGVSEDEVTATLERGQPGQAAVGRNARELVFPFNSQWQGKLYQQKKVRVVYIEEDDILIVITVYAYFGRWEEEKK